MNLDQIDKEIYAELVGDESENLFSKKNNEFLHKLFRIFGF